MARRAPSRADVAALAADPVSGRLIAIVTLMPAGDGLGLGGGGRLTPTLGAAVEAGEAVGATAVGVGRGVAVGLHAARTAAMASTATRRTMVIPPERPDENSGLPYCAMGSQTT
jgi:hypothetical protein